MKTVVLCVMAYPRLVELEMFPSASKMIHRKKFVYIIIVLIIYQIKKCRFGAPAFISFPHYYLADPSYTEMIEGMNPNPHDHTFDISLEPNTGLPLKVHAALQINLLIDRTHGIK